MFKGIMNYLFSGTCTCDYMWHISSIFTFISRFVKKCKFKNIPQKVNHESSRTTHVTETTEILPKKLGQNVGYGPKMIGNIDDTKMIRRPVPLKASGAKLERDCKNLKDGELLNYTE